MKTTRKMTNIFNHCTFQQVQIGTWKHQINLGKQNKDVFYFIFECWKNCTFLLSFFPSKVFTQSKTLLCNVLYQEFILDLILKFRIILPCHSINTRACITLCISVSCVCFRFFFCLTLILVIGFIMKSWSTYRQLQHSDDNALLGVLMIR